MHFFEKMDELALLLKGSHTWDSLMEKPMYKLEYIIQGRINKVTQAKKEFDATGVPNIYMQENGGSGGFAASLLGSALGSGGASTENHLPERMEFSQYLKMRESGGLNTNQPMTQADFLRSVREGNVNDMNGMPQQNQRPMTQADFRKAFRENHNNANGDGNTGPPPSQTEEYLKNLQNNK